MSELSLEASSIRAAETQATSAADVIEANVRQIVAEREIKALQEQKEKLERRDQISNAQRLGREFGFIGRIIGSLMDFFEDQMEMSLEAKLNQAKYGGNIGVKKEAPAQSFVQPEALEQAIKYMDASLDKTVEAGRELASEGRLPPSGIEVVVDSSRFAIRESVRFR